MFGIRVKPYQRGKNAFRKGILASANPFPNHDPPKKDDDRWYFWRQGWKRAEIESIIEQNGTCSGAHGLNGVEGSICQIGGEGWVSLDPGTSAAALGWAPIQCIKCGEIWSLDWGGYTREVSMEAARDPSLGHCFMRNDNTCSYCGIEGYPTITTPCPNKAGDKNVSELLMARKNMRIKEMEMKDAQQRIKEAESGLVTQGENEC